MKTEFETCVFIPNIQYARRWHVIAKEDGETLGYIDFSYPKRQYFFLTVQNQEVSIKQLADILDFLTSSSITKVAHPHITSKPESQWHEIHEVKNE